MIRIVELRVAIFTNKFPGRTVTFFARDIAPLLSAGVDVEIFPIYPVDPNLWRYVPDILSDRTLHRSKIHHVNLSQIVRSAPRARLRKIGGFICDTVAISVSA